MICVRTFSNEKVSDSNRELVLMLRLATIFKNTDRVCDSGVGHYVPTPTPRPQSSGKIGPDLCIWEERGLDLSTWHATVPDAELEPRSAEIIQESGSLRVPSSDPERSYVDDSSTGYHA